MSRNERNLTIQTVNIEVLIPSIYNPRKWSADAIEQLKESIQSFGLVDPILVNGIESKITLKDGGLRFYRPKTQDQ